MTVPEMTPLEWSRERLANSERIAAMKIGADRRGWLEDVAYWREIVRLLSQPKGKSAGDLLIEAVDRWIPHAQACGLEECSTCDVGINRLRLAYKVWQASQHKQATTEARS